MDLRVVHRSNLRCTWDDTFSSGVYEEAMTQLHVKVLEVRKLGEWSGLCQVRKCKMARSTSWLGRSVRARRRCTRWENDRHILESCMSGLCLTWWIVRESLSYWWEDFSGISQINGHWVHISGGTGYLARSYRWTAKWPLTTSKVATQR